MLRIVRGKEGLTVIGIDDFEMVHGSINLGVHFSEVVYMGISLLESITF